MHDRYVGSVIDVTTTEIVAEIAGSPWTAGPHRLEVAGELGLPQVVAPADEDQQGGQVREPDVRGHRSLR